MVCDKGTCCKWTYIILSIFCFMLGFLAFAPMYVTSPRGYCDAPESKTECSCHAWMGSDICDMADNDDGCYDQMCAYDQGCCEKEGFVYTVGGTTGDYNNGASSLFNMHGYGLGTVGCTKPTEDSDVTNAWNSDCALAGPDKIHMPSSGASAAWFDIWNGAKGFCGHRLTSEADGCNWENDVCECTVVLEFPPYQETHDPDCGKADCEAWDYTCSCNDTVCMATGTTYSEGLSECGDCDFTLTGTELKCTLNDKTCVTWGAEWTGAEQSAGSCSDAMEDYCPPNKTTVCKDKQNVHKNFFTAFLLFIFGEAVLGVAVVLSILSICTAKISCLKGCFTKFVRFFIAFALLAGSTFASASFALFDLGGVQMWGNLVTENGDFDGPVMCAGQPGVLFENTSLTGINSSWYSCFKRTPTFYLYVLLVVSLAWVACIAAFATICCCNPEKAEAEREEAP